jgi:hypothetical protein
MTDLSQFCCDISTELSVSQWVTIQLAVFELHLSALAQNLAAHQFRLSGC